MLLSVDQSAQNIPKMYKNKKISEVIMRTKKDLR